MFVHHVFFWMAPDASAVDRAALAAGIRSLSAIETIKMHHLGVPAATDRPVIERGYTFSWLLLFETAADEAVYQSHPIHLKFIEDCRHLWTKVVVYDTISL